jgi:hypothetical protein
MQYNQDNNWWTRGRWLAIECSSYIQLTLAGETQIQLSPDNFENASTFEMVTVT